MIERGRVLHGGRIAGGLAQIFSADRGAHNFAALRFGKLGNGMDRFGSECWAQRVNYSG